jgi:hypothetical protein
MYGTKGVAAAGNVPGARYYASGWTDSSGNLWLFGGIDGNSGQHNNDLWKFNDSKWTWVSGSSGTNQLGVYGTQGVADANNVPGARDSANIWTDSSGNLWLFGGNGTAAFMNDLWKFDGSVWTWVSGSSGTNQDFGVYGTIGVAAAGNSPGAREYAAGFTDSSGNFWMFGGVGMASVGGGLLNDLWKFDGSQWTWVSGGNLINPSGWYGTQGVAAANNVPGGRSGSAIFTDSSGKLWLFGGTGLDSAGAQAQLNDLWSIQP